MKNMTSEKFITEITIKVTKEQTAVQIRGSEIGMCMGATQLIEGVLSTVEGIEKKALIATLEELIKEAK